MLTFIISISRRYHVNCCFSLWLKLCRFFPRSVQPHLFASTSLNIRLILIPLFMFSLMHNLLVSSIVLCNDTTTGYYIGHCFLWSPEGLPSMTSELHPWRQNSTVIGPRDSNRDVTPSEQYVSVLWLVGGSYAMTSRFTSSLLGTYA